MPAQAQLLRTQFRLQWTNRLNDSERHRPTTRLWKLPTALLQRHRRRKDAGSRLKADLLAPPWKAPNPRVEAEPWRGSRNTEDDDVDERNPFPMRKDPKGPTDVDNVVDTNPELPLVEETSLTWIQTKKKSGNERNPSDIPRRKTGRTSPDSSSGKLGSEEGTNPTTSRPPSSLPLGVS